MSRSEEFPTIGEIPARVSRRDRLSRWPILTLFIVAGGSQIYLQVFAKGATVERANKMHRFEFTDVQFAKRGEILSRDGEPLAKDDGRSDLSVDFKRCPNTQPFWLDLSAATGIPATQFAAFAREAATSDRPKWERSWPRAISSSQTQSIETLISRWRADGVGVTLGGYRTYPLGDAASCLVGIVRKGFLPPDKRTPTDSESTSGPTQAHDELTGLEKSQDAILRGKDGKLVGVKDKNGNFLPMRVEWQKPKQDGKDITLTIDEGLQTFAAAQIKKTVEDFHAESGAVVVEDPRTGDLLAVANYPSFRPYSPDGNYSLLKGSAGLNQAYMSCLEPGSMFKILTLAKALDAGVVHMDDQFFCPGEKVVVPHSKPIKCDKHAGNRAMGPLDPVHAIAKSCNIWAATWAVQIGYDPFKSYLQQLGILDKPPIGVPGTRAALVNWKDPAKQLQLANLGFGQSINCTPVGLIGAFSTLANDGKRVPPRLIKKIGAKELPVPAATRILSAGACENVIKGMIAVMEDDHGTGRSLRIPGYCIAGKTGTAQKMAKNDSGYVSNFVGFVPAEHPRAVVLVMVNRPGGKHYYGAEVAGPVFKAMAQQLIHKYGLVATEPITTRPSISKAKPLEVAKHVDDEDDQDDAPVHPKPTRKRSFKSKLKADDA